MKSNMMDLVCRIGKIRTQMIRLIETLPAATPGVRVLNQEGTAAVVSSRVIAANGGILTPSYYLNSENKKTLIDRINRCSIENLGSIIEEVLEKEHIRHSNGWTTKVSPKFREALRKIWEG